MRKGGVRARGKGGTGSRGVGGWMREGAWRGWEESDQGEEQQGAQWHKCVQCDQPFVGPFVTVSERNEMQSSLTSIQPFLLQLPINTVFIAPIRLVLNNAPQQTIPAYHPWSL
jgi:hypothetical protein